MGDIVEAIPLRLYFHCGWAITVDPSFDAEVVAEGETLRIFDAGDHREISLSSMRFRRHDGRPMTADDVLDVFPPREMAGLHFEHRQGELAGRALWMFGESDTDEPAWVLMAIMVAAQQGKCARCTIVCRDEDDRDWALEVWRSIVLGERPS